MHFWQIHTNYLAGCSPFFHAGGNFPLVAGGRAQREMMRSCYLNLLVFVLMANEVL